jgi:hypothetical protein
LSVVFGSFHTCQKSGRIAAGVEDGHHALWGP